jgi:endonuclease YncB( thermonuclease family)
MKKISALLLACLLVGFQCQADTFSGKVIAVADGDTLTVLDQKMIQYKIRLAGIDAPERQQPYGEKSRQSLFDLTFNKTVTIETYKRDRFGREVGKVLIEGRDINVIQVERGLAWFYRKYQSEQSELDRKRYDEAQSEAQGANRGLWVDAGPMPPWEFRNSKN